jgi:erythromycin esterase-like protein
MPPTPPGSAAVPRAEPASRLDAGLAHPLLAAADDECLLQRLAGARFVLIGEASHGSHEFYRERAALTRRLIADHGFAGVAAEADWPDAWRVNRYVHGEGGDADADAALSGFRRFPTWMWRNIDVLDFVEWLRAHNATASQPAGFYGIDLYSLHASMDAVLGYLDRIDPAAALRARERYGCFDRFVESAQQYGHAIGLDITLSCEDEVVEQLLELQRNAARYLQDGAAAADAYFFAEQNARLVRNAEGYYRSMFRGRSSSWNLRDRHMLDTLQALATHLSRRGGEPARLVVWAHNSHLGDARATEMRLRGELNLGQLVRETWPDDCVLVGLTTYEGTVTAATDWDGPGELKRVRPGLAGSIESTLHGMGGDVWIDLGEPRVAAALRTPLLERAIGVIYRPDTERQSHYFEAELPRQFDLLLHYDRTTAVRPLEPDRGWHGGEPPETWPSGV